MSKQEQLDQVIATLQAQRAVLGDAIVDAMIAAARKELAQVDPSPRPALQGERKLVTVMFADIAGFTALAETMDPEAVRDLMNSCFEHLVPCSQKYGGTVDKFLGDAIMVLFGAPVTHENDAERALRAALEMMEALDSFNAARGTDLGLHVGINTGLVIAGGIGTSQHQEYSVMGDPVNLAKRLEDVSERGQILVGPDTYRLTEPIFEFESLPPVQVKGRTELLPIYRLLAPRAVPGQVRGIAGLSSPLVGRQAECQALQTAMRQLGAGRGGIVTLVGEAGLGKSRLVSQVYQDITPDFSWVEGRCLSYGGSIAYLLWLDILRALLGVSAEDSPVTTREALQAQVQELCPEYIEDVYPYLARLMALPLDSTAEIALQQLGGQELQRSTFQAMKYLLQCTARQQPFVLVCEDLHWADATSIELLEQLLPLAEQLPLLFLCVFRPEREQACWHLREVAIWQHQAHHTDLWLNPLSTQESAALVGHLLHVQDLPSDLRSRILDHAEGNPFYVEEIIRSLIDSGAIVRDESTGRWKATHDVAEITIPDTLQGVLLARIDRLRGETKRVLQLAAVIGRIFLHRVLEAIAQEERQLDQHLLTLQREEMIRERVCIPELEYIFKHQLTQEAAYNGMLKKERRSFHRRVAESLEELFPDRIQELLGLLAYHWEQAEEADKASEYLLRAGNQARLAYANQEAIGYYRRALALFEAQQDYEQAARTLMHLGLTYQNASDLANTRRSYEDGFGLWQKALEMEPAEPLPPAPHALREPVLEPQTLDPTLVVDVTGGGMAILLFSGLVRFGPNWTIVPDIAQSWEVLDQGRRYIFYLREGVLWSDGSPVTAGNVEYAWKRVLDPATEAPLASSLYDVKGAQAFHQGETGNPDSLGIRALDDLTLEVELEDPTAYFLHLLGLCITYPLPQHAIAAHGQDWTKLELIVTNGPFLLESWKKGESMALVRNPTYHGRFSGNVERMERLVGDKAALLELYAADRLDLLRLLTLPPEEIQRARQQYAADYFSITPATTYYLILNTKQPPFDQVWARRALALATDRDTLTNTIQQGFFTPATGGIVPPSLPGHNPGIALPYDPEQARQVLAEAGHPGGQEMPEIIFILTPSHAAVGEYLRQLWQETLGIQVHCQVIQSIPLSAPPHHIFLSGWIADYPDPDAMLRASDIPARTGWQHETYDELIRQAKQVLDHDRRMALYRQAEHILVEQVPILPLYYGCWHILAKPWIKNSHGLGLYTEIIIEPH